MPVRVIAFLCLAFPLGALAQGTQPQPGKPIKSNKISESSLIRESALSTLATALDELPSIKNIGLRIELTGTVVNLLARSRPNRCRKALNLLFDKAMEDRAGLLKARAGGTRPDSKPEQLDPDSAIRRVIQIAARLDEKLAQTFIKAYTDQEDPNGPDEATSRQKEFQIASAYLKIAIQLVEQNPQLALLTAEKSLHAGLMPESLVFLTTLRRKQVGLANNFFLAALQSCQARNGNDVNELLLLYSFVFSPGRVPVASPGGLAVYSLPGPTATADSYSVDARLATQYLNTVSNLLLGSSRYLPGNLERLSSGVVGDFYLLSLLESKVGEYLPRVAQSISSQRNVLANYLKSDDRTAATSSVERWNNISDEVNLVGSGNSATASYLEARAEQTSNPKLRSQLYFRAALAAIPDHQDERALALVSKLQPEYSEPARQLLKFAMAERYVREGKLDEAEQLARRDNVLVRRCFIFTLLANSLVKGKTKDFPRATQLLSEIEQLVRKLTSDEERLAVLEGAAVVYLSVDPGRAFEILRDTIIITTKLDRFTGYSSIDQSLEVGGFVFDFTIYDEEFGYFDLLRKLGKKDYYQTIQSVREIRNHSLQLHSTIVVCEAALSAV